MRTADDGAHWRGLGYLDAPSSADGGGGVSSIRFANESDGFAFGPDLYVTHNGARTWAKDAIGGKVRVLDAAAGNVFAVVSINGTDELLRSRASGGSWSRVSLPGDAAPAYASLAVHGSDVWIVGGGRSSQRYLFVSHDGGNSFETLHRACGANLGTALAPVSSSVIWALCVTGMQAELQLSRDGGRRFSGLPPPMPEIPNSAAFGAVDEHKVAVGPACEDLLIIDAQGRSKKAVGGRCNGVAADWAFVGFTDPLHGFALRYEFQTKVPTGELWHTIDGGAEWSKLLP